jgi:hypothetical protein
LINELLILFLLQRMRAQSLSVDMYLSDPHWLFSVRSNNCGKMELHELWQQQSLGPLLYYSRIKQFHLDHDDKWLLNIYHFWHCCHCLRLLMTPWLHTFVSNPIKTQKTSDCRWLSTMLDECTWARIYVAILSRNLDFHCAIAALWRWHCSTNGIVSVTDIQSENQILLFFIWGQWKRMCPHVICLEATHGHYPRQWRSPSIY